MLKVSELRQYCLNQENCRKRFNYESFCFFSGGHTEFHRKHKDLCEDTLVSGLTSRGLPSSASCPALSDIDSHPASRVLPFLYLGNSKNAADLSCLQDLGTTCVLNVTPQLAGYHETCGITYKQIPATDNGHQNLKQYFEEAFEFIGKLLTHLFAGFLRSHCFRPDAVKSTVNYSLFSRRSNLRFWS